MLAGRNIKYSWLCVSFGDFSFDSFWLILSSSFGGFLTCFPLICPQLKTQGFEDSGALSECAPLFSGALSCEA